MARPRTTNSKIRGFTLLEVIIAFVIMALILGVTFDTFSTGFRQAALSGRYADAVVRAETQLSLIGHIEPLAVGVKTGQFDQFYSWRTEITPVPQADPETPEEDRLGLYNVVLSVFWGEGENARDVTLHTHRLNVLEAP